MKHTSSHRLLLAHRPRDLCPRHPHLPLRFSSFHLSQALFTVMDGPASKHLPAGKEQMDVCVSEMWRNREWETETQPSIFCLSPCLYSSYLHPLLVCRTHTHTYTYTPLTWVLQSVNVKAHLLLENTLASWRDMRHTELSYLAVASSLAGGKQVDQPKHASPNRCVRASASYITR